MKKYCKTLKEAREIFRQRAGYDYGDPKQAGSLCIYKLRHGRNKGKYFIGSHFEWLNLY